MSGNVTSLAGQLGPAGLACDEAAQLLDVAPAALVQWSRQFGFPADVGDGSPRFRREEIDVLARTLVNAHSIEGAIQDARNRLGHDG